jgi:hypothetical protein
MASNMQLMRLYDSLKSIPYTPATPEEDQQISTAIESMADKTPRPNTAGSTDKQLSAAKNVIAALAKKVIGIVWTSLTPLARPPLTTTIDLQGENSMLRPELVTASNPATMLLHENIAFEETHADTNSDGSRTASPWTCNRDPRLEKEQSILRTTGSDLTTYYESRLETAERFDSTMLMHTIEARIGNRDLLKEFQTEATNLIDRHMSGHKAQLQKILADAIDLRSTNHAPSSDLEARLYASEEHVRSLTKQLQDSRDQAALEHEIRGRECNELKERVIFMGAARSRIMLGISDLLGGEFYLDQSYFNCCILDWKESELHELFETETMDTIQRIRMSLRIKNRCVDTIGILEEHIGILMEEIECLEEQLATES